LKEGHFRWTAWQPVEPVKLGVAAMQLETRGAIQFEVGGLQATPLHHLDVDLCKYDFDLDHIHDLDHDHTIDHNCFFLFMLLVVVASSTVADTA
jgi:hypothetical protein